MITPRISRRHVQDDVADIVSRTSGVPMLEVSNLVKRYGDVLALDGCSLQVPAGHLVGLLGPNGAGKTTVMRTLFGPGAAGCRHGAVAWAPGGCALLAAVRVHAGGTGLYPSMRVGSRSPTSAGSAG